MQENNTNIVEEDTTCFNEHKKRNLTCENSNCRQWLNKCEYLNCAILGAEKGEHTLQEIGDIFGVTRMRVCQMEKNILRYLLSKKAIKKS